jgi:hypothetical protein
LRLGGEGQRQRRLRGEDRPAIDGGVSADEEAGEHAGADAASAAVCRMRLARQDQRLTWHGCVPKAGFGEERVAGEPDEASRMDHLVDDQLAARRCPRELTRRTRAARA